MNKTLWILLALAVVAVVVMWLGARGRISSKEARELVAGGARLVDVRTPGEFAAGHLDGALNVPVQDLSARFGELGPKERPLVLYCRSGARSARAAGLLRDAGFTAVHDLGGMSRW